MSKSPRSDLVWIASHIAKLQLYVQPYSKGQDGEQHEENQEIKAKYN